jgi:hypothetical protein
MAHYPNDYSAARLPAVAGVALREIARRKAMKNNLAAISALAGGFLLTATLSAGAAPSVSLKSSLDSGSALVQLARDGGGGGGGGGHSGGGGGGHSGGGGGGGDRAGGGSPGGGGAALKGGGDGGGPSGRVAGRGGGGDSFKGRSGGDFKSGRSGRVARGGGDWDGDGKNWNRGKDHGKSRHGKNFRRYGPDIFVYGGGYGYGDCGWLRRQAVITGSPYWWQRYQDCVYYD